MKLVYDINQKPPIKKNLVYAFQQVLAIMAATLLVPMLVNLNSGTNYMSQPAALCGAGFGTLFYLFATRRKSPVFLGSSFAFIQPLVSAVAFGYLGIFLGAVFSGLVYALIALVIKKTGSGWVNKLLPPVVIGPTVALIGLSLCGSAVNNLNNTASGSYSLIHIALGLFAFLVTVWASVKGTKGMKMIPFIIGILSAYIVGLVLTLIGNASGCAALQIINLSAFDGVGLIHIPEFTFLGFFKKQANKLELMKARYDKAEVSVEKISDALQQHQIRLMKDSAMLDQMYDQNLAYFKELTMYILAGKQKLEEVRAGKLAELEATAQRTGLAEDVQAAKDLADKCQRFEKKIYDLELTRAISMQTAPQIRMIQNNDNVMVEKIQTTLVNTIPLWKNQMVITLGIAHASEAAAAQRQVNDVTNSLLQANAKRLHTASVETAKEAERGIVDIETLKKTNAELIQTLDDVMKIQQNGRTQRLAAEAEMAKMESDLKNKLLQIRSGS